MPTTTIHWSGTWSPGSSSSQAATATPIDGVEQAASVYLEAIDRAQRAVKAGTAAR